MLQYFELFLEGGEDNRRDQPAYLAAIDAQHCDALPIPRRGKPPLRRRQPRQLSITGAALGGLPCFTKLSCHRHRHRHYCCCRPRCYFHAAGESSLDSRAACSHDCRLEYKSHQACKDMILGNQYIVTGTPKCSMQQLAFYKTPQIRCLKQLPFEDTIGDHLRKHKAPWISRIKCTLIYTISKARFPSKFLV